MIGVASASAIIAGTRLLRSRSPLGPIFSLCLILTGIAGVSWHGAILLRGGSHHDFALAEGVFFAAILSSGVAIAVRHLVMQTERIQTELDRRVAAEAALARAVEERSRTERLAAMGTLVAGVAHEVNNPLTYIRGNIELARMALREAIDGRPSGEAAAPLEDADQRLATAEAGISRIATITRGLRRFAVAQPGVRKLEDPATIVDGVLELMHAQLVDVEVRRSYDSHSLVEADQADLSHVMLNLVSNAVTAMAHAERRVLTVGTRDEGGMVALTVEDTGQGIPPEIASQIFTPFFTTKPEGTGLGLSVSQRIVRDCGGRVEFDTSPRGTCFRVLLPAKAPSGPIGGHPTLAPSLAAPASSGNGNAV